MSVVALRSRQSGQLRACAGCGRVRGDIVLVEVLTALHFAELRLCGICIEQTRADALVVIEHLEGAA